MRDTTPNFEPHLAEDGDGFWYVRMKERLGEYRVLWARDGAGKYAAAKALRAIRREMAEAWWNARQETAGEAR